MASVPGCRGAGSGLVQHAAAVSLAKAQLCPAQLARLSRSSIPKGPVASPALQPPPSDPRQMGLRMQPLLGPSSQRQGWLPQPPRPPPSSGRPQQPETGVAGPSGGATWASPEPASSQAGPTMAPFTGERAGPSRAHRVMSLAPGTRSGKSETQEGVAKTGTVRGAQPSTPPPTYTPPRLSHVKVTTAPRGDQLSWGRPGAGAGGGE